MIHESLGFAYWRKQKQFLESSPFLSNILIWEHPPVSSAVNDTCLTPRPVDLGSQQGCSTTSTKWKPHKVDQWRIPTALGNIFVPGWEANSVTLSHRFHLQQEKKKNRAEQEWPSTCQCCSHERHWQQGVNRPYTIAPVSLGFFHSVLRGRIELGCRSNLSFIKAFSSRIHKNFLFSNSETADAKELLRFSGISDYAFQIFLHIMNYLLVS